MKKFTIMMLAATSFSFLAFTPVYAQSYGSGGQYSSTPLKSSGATNGNTSYFDAAFGNSGSILFLKRQISNKAAAKNQDKFEAALVALKNNEFEQADVLFTHLHTQAMGRYALRSVLNYHQGIAQMGLGNTEKATKLFKSASRSRQTSYEANAVLGIIYASSGQDKKAQRTLKNLKRKAKNCNSECPNEGRINNAVKRLETMFNNDA